MGYNSKIESPVWLSKYHHQLVIQLGKLPDNRRGKRQQIEFLIEQAAKEAGILDLQV